MIKRIFGEDNGLELSVSEKEIYLYPGKKSRLKIHAKNSTEYDMHLFLSFGELVGAVMDKRETDVFVPAQGETYFDFPLTLKSDERMYMGCLVSEFSVTDRVLEWTSGYELVMFSENVFKCGERGDFSANDEMLFSDKGRIFIGENECVMLEAACVSDTEVIFESQVPEKISLYLDGNRQECENILLKGGLNKICIESLCEQQIAFKDIYSDKVICLNTVNPKYYL